MISIRTKQSRYLWGCLFMLLFCVVVVLLPAHVHAQVAEGITRVDNAGLSLSNQPLEVTIVKVIRIILGLLGLIAVSIVLYGGFVYMTSAGNEEKITKAKTILRNGLIGLVIILFSVAIVQFVMNKLLDASGFNDRTTEIIDGGCTSASGCTVPVCSDVFGAQSITPHQSSTGMNNIVIRAVFTVGVGSDADEVLQIMRGGVDITNQFSYSFVSGSGKRVIEAVMPVGDQARCSSLDVPATTGCLPVSADAYIVTVNDTIVDVQGNGVQFGDEACPAFTLMKSVDFVVDAERNDIVPPEVQSFGLIDPETGNLYTATQPRIPSGRTYTISTLMNDRLRENYGGMGYAHVRLSSPGEPDMDLYRGPASTESSSDAYAFGEPINLYAGITHASGKPKKYELSLTAWDIDHNSTTVTSSFVLVGPLCFNGVQDPGETDIDVGGECGSDTSCSEDFECASGTCVDGQCVARPQITDVSPAMDGAPGNWLTIRGYYFGTSVGKVEFGLDDQWVEASLVQCTDLVAGSTWNNSYAIVEVPPQLETTNGAIGLQGNGHIALSPPGSSRTPDQQWTIGLWIYVDSLGQGTQPLFALGTPAQSLNVVVDPDNRVRLIHLVDGAEQTVASSYGEQTALLKEKTWMFMTLSENTNGGKLMTLNGTQYLSSPAFSSLEMESDAAPQLLLGKTFIDGSELRGAFDEVAVFPTYAIASTLYSSLSGPAIAHDSTQYRTNVFSLDPVWYWRLGDNKPTALFESIAKVNAGAVVGTATMRVNGVFGDTNNLFDATSATHYFPFEDGGCETADQRSDTIASLGPNCGGENAPDHSPNGHTGQALLFDGQDDEVDLHIPYNTNTDITISAWYNTTDFQTPQMTILGGNAGGRLEMYVSNGRPSCRIFHATSHQTILLADEAYVGSWHQIACTVQYEPTPKTSLYVDGVLLKSTDAVPTVIPGGKWFVGKSASSGKPFRGLIDDVTIWNKSLGTSSDVAIRVTTADGQYSDTTIDDFGPQPGTHNGYFTYTDTVRPGLCSVVVDGGALDGASAGPPGVQIRAKGKGFADQVSGDEIQFVVKSAAGTTIAGDVQGWTEQIIRTIVPINFAPGKPLVQVKKGTEVSNGIPFQVTKGDLSDAKPIITSIDPGDPTPGSYVTISGKNFGSAGVVYITQQKGATCPGTGCIALDVPGLPCEHTWTDTQIVVEIKNNFTQYGSWYTIVKRADNQLQSDGIVDEMSIQNGAPLPSICSLSPTEGPAPLPDSLPRLTFLGKNFTGKDQNASPILYFWNGTKVMNSETIAQDPDTANSAWIAWDGSREKNAHPDWWKVEGDGTRVISSVGYSATGDSMPFGTWPITIKAGGKRGNSVSYTVQDCRVQTTAPRAGLTCCAEGPDTGSWKTFCKGQTVNAGYVWRFTTGIPVATPRVVERCDATNWFTSKPVGEVSPVPSTMWPDSDNMCLNATVQVAFSTAIDPTSVNASTTYMYECGTLETPVKDCIPVSITPTLASETLVKIVDGTFDSTSSVLKAGKAYRVVLTTDITSVSQPVAGGGVAKIPLERTVTNSGLLNGFDDTGKDAAYYFQFKAGDSYCSLDSASIVPSEKTVTVLGPLMSQYSQDNLFYYSIFGKADRVCTILGVGDLPWTWTSQNTGFATVTKAPYGDADHIQHDKATAEAKSHAPQGVEFYASAPTAGTILSEEFPGGIEASSTTLRILLGKPNVIYYEPNCAEACPNGVILARFNRHVAESTYAQGIQLYKCDNVDCGSPEIVSYTLDLEKTNSLQVVVVPNSKLEIDTYYKVEMHDIVGLKNIDTGEWDGQTIEPVEWYFRTKQDGTLCAVDHVGVTPNPFTAIYVGQKTKFSATPYGAPNKCSSQGQALSQWNTTYEYRWQSTTSSVASITTFQQTLSSKNYCTQACLPAGSDIPFDKADTPLCGNGAVEAGEDCDTPGTNGCTMNCVLETKAKTGTSQNFNPAVAGFCGDGKVGAQEDCDIAIQTDDMRATTQAYGCSASCLHTGTPLAAKWCIGKQDIDACSTALSVCGNGVEEPGEQCDRNDSNNTYCSPSCLYYDADPTDAQHGICGMSGVEQCTAGTEGCTDICTWAGSSLLYKAPSLCGDGVGGTGEVMACEQGGSGTTQAPLQIATALGLGVTDGNGQQKTDIVASMPGQPGVVGSAEYTLQCGYTESVTELTTSTISVPSMYNDCSANTANEYGVGINSCCYERPVRMVGREYPVDGTGFGAALPACRNTYVSVEFSSAVDPATIQDHALLVRGYTTTDPSVCASEGGENVTHLVNMALGRVLITADAGGGFWSGLWNALKRTFHRLTDIVFAQTDLNSIKTWCTTDVTLSTDAVEPSLVIPLTISNLLGEDTAETTYAVLLKGGNDGIATVAGVGIKHPTRPVILDLWAFKVGKEVCRIDHVGVAPSSFVFTSPNTSTDFVAAAITKQGQIITPTPPYSWVWSWHPTSTAVFNIPANGASASLAETELGSTNVEGSLTAVARATIVTDMSTTGNQLDTALDGYTKLTSLFCEHPWPAGSSVVDGTWTPFQDTRFNYSFSYCADAGESGVTTDDLPYLIPQVVVSSTTPTADGTLKKILFVSTENDDAIGVQIFENPERLTADAWYRKKFPNAAPPQVISQPGGYDAIVVGDNYYINAVNVVQPSKSIEKYYNNIYLFTISQGAQASTHDVFDQIRDSLEFNTNLTDFQFCKNGAGQPDFQNLCTTDFACTATTTGGGTVASVVGLCDAEKTKLHRDLERLQDIKTIQTALGTSRLPQLNEGTFRKNYVSSKWASWGAFANAVGTNLPQDPINTWEECGTADPTTCWDAQQSVFICPRDASVYEYEYHDDALEKTYTLHAPMEFFTNEAHLKSEFSAFIPDPNSFTTSRGCTPLDSYSFTSLTCGDGVVGPGEQCDPPGSVSIGGQGNAGACTEGMYATQTCNSSCHLEYGACQSTGTCGNGIVEKYEVCDDGVLNGKYGQCAGPNSYPNNPEKACQLLHTQSCGNGIVDKDSKGNPLEFCDVGAPDKSLYSPLKENSCKWDCQTYGSYCGDGIKDSAEACDDGNNASADGCSALCEVENRACIIEKPQYKTYQEKTYITLESFTESDRSIFQNTLIPAIHTNQSQSQFIPGTPYPGCTTAITGNEICKSFGLTCDGIAQVIDSQTNNLSANQYGCATNISTFASDIESSEKTHILVCNGSFTGYASAGLERDPSAEIPVIPGCGNGKLDTGEQCDYMTTGTKKFADCSALPYGSKSCTYCTEQCHTETTEPAAGFCGNGKIDQITPGTSEVCDMNSSGQVISSTGVAVSSCQIGNISCTNNCTVLDTSQCLACGENPTGPIAKIAYLNPMLGSNQTWPTNDFASYLLNKNISNDLNAVGSQSPVSASAQAFQSALLTPGDLHITANPMCTVTSCTSSQDCDGFGYRVTFGSGDAFPYPVKNEKTTVTNEYVLSPALPEGTIRVVMRWSKQEQSAGHAYAGGLYSGEGFNLIGTRVTLSDFKSTTQDNLCTQMILEQPYWVPRVEGTNCYAIQDTGMTRGNIFVHGGASTQNTYIQSFTIDTTQLATNRKDPIAFYVEDGGTGEIFSSQNTTLRVDVYTYHATQNASTDAFKPTQTFEIKNAQKSTNTQAKVWHVFNITPDGAVGSPVPPGSTRWNIEPVQTVRSAQCDLEHAIYEELQCPQT